MGEVKESGGERGIIRKIDDAVFAVEKSIVSFALFTIPIVLFIDVIARRITAPDSKIGALICRLGGIDDFETRAWVDANVAPWVTMGLAFFLLGFGLFSARRFARQRAGEERVDLRRELGLAAAFAVAGIGLGWGFAYVFEQLESWMVYAGVFGVGGAGVIGFLYQDRSEGWKIRAAGTLGAVAVLEWVCVHYVPEGYTWSKKISLLLLLWVGLLSASICVYAGKHIRMGAVQKLLPEKARRFLNGAGFLGATVFCALMTALGFDYIFGLKASDDEFMTQAFMWEGTRYVYGFEGMFGRGGFLEGTDIPDWLGILSAPVGFGIATVRFLGAGISSFLGGSYGESGIEEGMAEAEEAKAAETAKELEAEQKLEVDQKLETAPGDEPEPGPSAEEE